MPPARGWDGVSPPPRAAPLSSRLPFPSFPFLSFPFPSSLPSTASLGWLGRGGEPASRSDALISRRPSTPAAQMQWIILMLLLFISSVEMLAQNRWKKQVSAGLFENCTGCVLCSEDNGCITCHHRLFLLIWRDGIRQYGMCVHTCPPGYFGVRGLEVNRCTTPLPGRVQVAQLRELLQQGLLHEVQGEVLPAQGPVLPAVPARHRGAARHPRVPRDVRAGALERVERLHPRGPDLRLQVGPGDAGARGPGRPARGGGFLPPAAGDPKVPPEEALPRRENQTQK
ncbi:R-spondin-4 isoform X2 [Cygnus olor]|uniref:R-spondin-4 isoform X2 n=1 Tax=Cygnus olor TaxID=8869 RepID=UPI001ADDEFA3|nr:R-spondin-4 isoform X2 [Cygnus olor]XP_050569982.1 R-spondin-4 isoform X2 [Cygnus atratus]